MKIHEKKFIYYYLIKEVPILRQFLNDIDPKYDYAKFLETTKLKQISYDMHTQRAKAIYVAHQELNIDFFTINDDFYPAGLKELVNPPIILYFIGNTSVFKKEAIAMIGSRSENEEVFKRVRKVAKKVDERGYAVVSGLANGIDYESQNAIVKNGNNCIGVIPGPLLNISPAASRGLFKEIIKHDSIVISEYDVLMPYDVKYYNERNRIIVAIATRVIVGNILRKPGTNFYGGTANALTTAKKLDRDIFYFDNNYDYHAHDYLRSIEAKPM